MNEEKLSKISNNYNLKAIFSFLDYQYILKLIEKNKSLQKRLGIKLEDYKNLSNYPIYDFQKKKHTIEYRIPDNQYRDVFYKVLCLNCVHFTYVLIYGILLVCKVSFNGTNGAKDNYESLAKFIYTINSCLFILPLANIASTFLLLFFLIKEDDITYNYGLKRLIKIILIILYNIICISFEGLVICKLILSYKIKSEEEIWFIVLDYIFLILHLYYIYVLIYLSYIFLKYYIIHYRTDTSYHILSLNDIGIVEYNVSKDFAKMSKRDRKEFLLNNYKNISYNISSGQKNLIKIINEYRKNNSLQELLIDKLNKIPSFIMNEPSEIKMNSDQHIFKLSYKEYLFKYIVGEFEKNFKNGDMNILKILSDEKLNYIKIITRNNFEYIFLCKLSVFESYEDNIDDIILN